jgi:hypothetical protein
MPFGSNLAQFSKVVHDAIKNYPTHFVMSVYIVDSVGYQMASGLELDIPHDVKYSYKPLISQYQTRGGIVQEHWGDDLDTINVKGATASFIHPTCGLTRTQARQTLAYSQFLDTIDVYLNNGCIYDNTGKIIDRAARGNPAASVGGKVVIYYSAGLFEGFFTEFNYEESSDQPYHFLFDFTFRVQRVILGY